jgi:hypothetical protein
MLLSMVFLEYTAMPPTIGMLLFSTSLSLGPVSLVSAIPVILPLSLVGTGMGLIKSCTNIGASLYDISTGLIQDADPNKGYSGVMIFFMIISGLAVVAGAVLRILDATVYDHLLDRKGVDKHRLDGNKISNPKPAMPNQVQKSNYFYGATYLLLAALSWVLFFRFIMV